MNEAVRIQDEIQSIVARDRGKEERHDSRTTCFLTVDGHHQSTACNMHSHKTRHKSEQISRHSPQDTPKLRS